MLEPRCDVSTEEKQIGDRLPDALNEGAVMLQWVTKKGLLAEVAERFQINRQGGYCALDLFVFLVLFYCAGATWSIKDFWKRISDCHELLAAAANRKRLPTTASVSRILGAVEAGDFESFARWLLLDGCAAHAFMADPSVFYKDTKGQSWHVFDLDATSTVLRHRALPDGQELPQGKRRSAQAKGGYMGRKRGEVKVSRTTLQHAGSGLWAGLWTSPGNGAWRAESRKAAEAVAGICAGIKHPVERAVVRVDGAGGNAPFFKCCNDVGIHCVARLSRYHLLDDPSIRTHLNGCKWYEVPDSGSGPRRQVAELGIFTFLCENSIQPESLPEADPGFIRCRVVVTRFPQQERHGDGRSIDGWQYEMFGATLPADAWPAPELVELYFGRNALENRFAQEDREIGLDRIASYHVPGQHVANMIGLYVWNVRLCRGAQLVDLSCELHEQMARTTHVTDPTVSLPVDLPSTAGATATEQDVNEADEDAEPQHVGVLITTTTMDIEGGEADAGQDEDEDDHDTTTNVPSNAVIESDAADMLQTDAESALAAASLVERRNNLVTSLSTLNWPELLERSVGWSYNESISGLTCPAGVAVPLSKVDLRSKSTGQLCFRAPLPACSACALRVECTKSEKQQYRKTVTITVPRPSAKAVAQHLSLFRSSKPLVETRPKRKPIPKLRTRKMVRTWTRMSSETTMVVAGTFSVQGPILRPAVLRHLFSDLVETVAIIVERRLAARPKVCPRHLALSPADRQNRRKTWAQRLDWNALQSGDCIHLRYVGPAKALVKLAKIAVVPTVGEIGSHAA